MPTRSPDVWAQIWEWLLNNIGSPPFSYALSSVIAVVLRTLFLRRKRNFWDLTFDALICALITYSATPMIEQVFGHQEYSNFAGVMIGFIGTEKLREYLFKFVNQRVKQSDYPFNTRNDNDAYGEDVPDERD
ncbi:phage holin, lambda family [Testudinibacter sp. P80/BLE/0925]